MGVPEGEVALQGAVEYSAGSGPGVVISVLQPGWIEKGDVSRFEFRFGPADTHARLFYDTASDFWGAQWLSVLGNYSRVQPAYQVDDSPIYRTSQLGLTWHTPVNDGWFKGWQLDWGIRFENKGVQSPASVASSFYSQYAAPASFVIPSVALGRSSRASPDPLAAGTTDLVTLEGSLAGQGGRFVKVEARRDQYWEIDRSLILNVYGSLGYGKALGSGNFPLTQRFLSSGRDNVRGFLPGTLGPTDPANNAVGGLRKAFVSAEGYLRAAELFGEPLYVSTFIDAGRLDGADVGVDVRRNYVGYGVGLMWRAPSGLVKFNFARPLSQQPGDRTQSFSVELKTQLP